MLTVDTVLQERYRIVRQLGQGGMGAVYEAVDERLDKTVAIKEILLELENTSDKKQKDLIKQAFRREANSLVKARHSAVPDVTDYFSDLDREFLVMEYIEGDDLMKMLHKRNKPFLIEEVLPWIDQLLVALNYLHNLTPPIIHRDIKPQNLKLNEWQKMKLLDFGVAKSTDKAATVTQLTFVGATLSYSPIEQILRVIDPMFRELILLQHKEKAERILAQDTDSRCDIFALGATFYHLLTNYPPVDITKRTLETWEGKGDPLPHPSKINAGLPSAISSWILKAMAIERDNRFESAREMRSALNAAIVQANQENQARDLANLQKKDEKIDSREKILMQAETQRLIEIPELEKATVQDTMPPQTNPADSETTDTFSSIGVESTDYKFSNTDSAVFKTSDNLTELVYYDEEELAKDKKESEIEQKESEFIPPTEEISGGLVNGKFNIMMMLPIIGVLALVVLGGGVFGIAMFMNYSATPDENQSVIENRKTEITGTPEVTPDIETNLNASEPDLNDTADTNPDTSDSSYSNVSETTTTVNPTAQPTRNVTVQPTKPPYVQPTRQPPVVRQTPRPTTAPPAKKIDPTPKKKKLSDDCIYNGKCN